LIEDYLTNRLDDGASKAFEQQMQGDLQLQAEVNMQRTIIEGVKSARAAELKAMLNNVPISGATSSALTGKIAIATISTAIIGTALYFGLRTNPAEQPPVEQPAIEESISQQNIEPEAIETVPEVTEEVAKEETNKPKKTATPKSSSPKAVSPNIDVVDLTKDMEDSKEETSVPKLSEKPEVTTSNLEVETDNTNKSYSFHYQFKDGKLLLYGPFDASLYEIIEINGGSHHVFLYYKNSYYNLNELEQQVTPLIMIRDFELLAKLEQFRNKK
jgi:hypothetical protein